MQRRRFLSHTAAGTLAAPLAAALPFGAAAQARPMDVLVVANEFGPNSLDIHTVGALGEVLQLLRMPDGTVKPLKFVRNAAKPAAADA